MALGCKNQHRKKKQRPTSRDDVAWHVDCKTQRRSKKPHRAPQQESQSIRLAFLLTARLPPLLPLSNPLLDMPQRFLYLVHQDQAELARVQVRQRGVDGEEFPADLFHRAGARRALQAFA